MNNTMPQNEELFRDEEIIYRLIANCPDEHRESLEAILLAQLSDTDQKEWKEIVAGKRLPSLSSDIIAKKIFNADENKERLEYLLRGVTGEDDIVVQKSCANEGYMASQGSKRIIFDIPALLGDGRRLSAEFQASAQEFIVERSEIYAADLLLWQYSVNPGQKKGDLDYLDVDGVLVVVLMQNSPKIFKEFDKQTDHYIHRSHRWVADNSGISFPSLFDIVFVQLDKCLSQFKKGVNGEKDDRLQLLLAALADVNNAKVRNVMMQDEMFRQIMEDVKLISSDKEVQAMFLAEKYAMADLNAVKAYERTAGVETGEEKMLTLIECLNNQGFGDKATEIVKDKRAREALYKKYHIE